MDGSSAKGTYIRQPHSQLAAPMNCRWLCNFHTQVYVPLSETTTTRSAQLVQKQQTGDE